MRLIDIVMQTPKTQVCEVGSTRRVMPAAGALSEALEACTLRYVLDRAASAQVSKLVFTPGGPLAEPDELVRLPNKPFWLECFPDEGREGAAGHRAPGRLGFYVQPTDDGFAGTIDCVSETNLGEAAIVAGKVVFDLAQEPTGKSMYRMRHANNAEIDRLLGKARLQISDDWEGLVRNAPGKYSEFLAWHARRAWVAVPLLLAFSALLNSRSALVQRPSSLARLNQARAKGARPALLEHVEVGLNLTPPDSSVGRVAYGGDARHPPCLHFVRGHSVTRAGNTFWRSSHFRGDGVVERTRTIRVTAGVGRASPSRSH